MQQFLFVAIAHFLALLSPGPDFFLVARTSVRAGWRHAANVCLGIAIANGVLILAALSGITLFRPDSISFIVIQLTGCAYLLYIGVLFIRFAGANSVSEYNVKKHGTVTESAGVWRHCSEFSMGFLSGILNPKNALFYVSLATLIGGTTVISLKVVYGVWMFSIVLLWDLLIAIFIGNRVILKYFSQILPWLERVSGLILIGLALSVIMINLIALA